LIRLTVRDMFCVEYGHHTAVATHFPRYAGIPLTVTLLRTTCQPFPDCVEFNVESMANPAVLTITTATIAVASTVVPIPARFERIATIVYLLGGQLIIIVRPLAGCPGISSTELTPIIKRRAFWHLPVLASNQLPWRLRICSICPTQFEVDARRVNPGGSSTTEADLAS
jgi:hypothetical protein